MPGVTGDFGDQVLDDPAHLPADQLRRVPRRGRSRDDRVEVRGLDDLAEPANGLVVCREEALDGHPAGRLSRNHPIGSGIGASGEVRRGGNRCAPAVGHSASGG